MPELHVIWEAVISLLLITAGVLSLIGALGLLRFKDFYMRLHGPTKSSTLGVGCTLIASVAYFWLQEGTPSAQEMLITLFLIITAPVSAHLLAMSALHHKLPLYERTQGEPVELKTKEKPQDSERT
ncbi:Na+/H+ antiporter subunit G [Phytohalomonas tamaricis]|uniref:Na+/H+ antiporter subunit G n=1 Tax=Phytohalomonas tamaricis TaxID=2081032 RepID=UPI000D0B7110|nr:Na+/H+ antiporter subunit G [Phytohalomonas tamaricis]